MFILDDEDESALALPRDYGVDNRAFSVIGSDGGLLEAPVSLSAVQLSPGERAEIVVAFTPGERVRLQSGPGHGVAAARRAAAP
jgi:FtsP/CotA-like multicopper oxidase with cupredoxin domain